MPNHYFKPVKDSKAKERHEGNNEHAKYDINDMESGRKEEIHKDMTDRDILQTLLKGKTFSAYMHKHY